MTITHNLVFDTAEQAAEYQRIAKSHWVHLRGTCFMKFTQHANVLVVNDVTFMKLTSGYILDDACAR